MRWPWTSGTQSGDSGLMLARLRHAFWLLVEIARFSVATRTYWFMPFVLLLFLLMTIAGAAEVVVPYAIYPIF